jgi:large repetitive protein
VGTGTADQTGRFKVQFDMAHALRADGSQDGMLTFRVRAMDGAGAIGEPVAISFILDTHPVILRVNLDPASDSGRSNSDGITNVTLPTIDGTVMQAGPLTMNIMDGSTLVGTGTTDATGHFMITLTQDLGVLHPNADFLTVSLMVTAEHGTTSATFTFNFTLDTVPAAAPAAPQLQNGQMVNGQLVAPTTTPTFTGTVQDFAGSETTAQVILRAKIHGTSGNPVEVDNPATPVFIDTQGNYSISVNSATPLTFGQKYDITIEVIDLAGNVSTDSTPPVTVLIDQAPTINTVALAAGSDSGNPDVPGSTSDGITNVRMPVISGNVMQFQSSTITITDVTPGVVNPHSPWHGTTDSGGNFNIAIDVSSDISGNTPDAQIQLQIQAVQSILASTASFSFTLETSVPVATPPLLMGDNGSHQTNNLTPSFTGTGEVGAEVFLLANGTRVDNPAAPHTFVDATGHYTIAVNPATPLANNTTYQIAVKLEDVAGNTSGLSSPPLTIVTNQRTLTTPTLVLDPAYNFSLTGNLAVVIPQLYDGTSDPGTTVTVKDGSVVVDTFTNGASGHFSQFIALADGQHTLTAVASDSAGNVSAPATLIVTVDTTRLDPDHKFVTAIYQLALGRPGSLLEWNPWVALLSQPNGRFMVANQIERSFEALHRDVVGWYQTYLGRTPSNAEVLPYVNTMMAGATEEQMLAGILGSPEYTNHVATLPGFTGGPSDSNFIRGLYVQLLNRTPNQSEINGWLNVLPTLGHTTVATLFLTSAEYRSDVVNNFYSVILRRSSPPAAFEVNFWVNSGIDFLTMKIDFEASPEFFFRVTGSFPPS